MAKPRNLQQKLAGAAQRKPRAVSLAAPPSDRLARAVKLFGKPWRAPVAVERPLPPRGEEVGFDADAPSKGAAKELGPQPNDLKGLGHDSTSKEIGGEPARNGAKPALDRMAVPEVETARTRGPTASGAWAVDGATERLIRLWTVEGLSAGEIAADLTEFTGRSVSRSAVMSKIRWLGLTGKGGRTAQGGRAKAPPATKPENRADLSTGAAAQKPESVAERISLQNPTSAAKPQHRPEPDVVALFGAPRTPPTVRGSGPYRIDELGPGQCRYAVTPDDAASHRFCGARTRLQAGNWHGSWCDEHLAVVWSAGSSWDARRKRA